jgi:NAD+ diphosphatase
VLARANLSISHIARVRTFRTGGARGRKALQRKGRNVEDLITFGTSNLDRAGELRGDADALAKLLKSEGAGVLAMWRGKPLMVGDALAWAPADHAIFAQADEAPVFLGRDENGPRFTQDISTWEPDTDASEVGAFLDQSTQHHPDAPEGAGFTELRGVMTRLSRRDAELAASARAVLAWHESHGFCAKCGAKSEISQGGWQRHCPDCGAKHFPRTDPVAIMLITHGNDVLVGRSPFWPEGFYSLLAGFIEPGETVEAAVRREVFEEAGVRVGKVRYLASQPWPFPSSLMMGCAGEATSRDITVDETELADARWVSREEMVQVFAGTHPEMGEPRKGAIAHSLLHAWLSDRLG